MTRFAPYFISLIACVLLIACENQEKNTFEKRESLNIKGLNADLQDSVGIDLLAYKSKIDQKFSSDSFYVNVCEDLLFNTGESRIYNAFGPTLTYDSGDSILPSHGDSLFRMIFHSVGKNIYLDDCSSEILDTNYCQFKNQAVKNSKGVTGVFTLSVISTIGDVYGQYKKGYLNYQELSYMVIVHHLFRDISYLDNERH